MTATTKSAKSIQEVGRLPGFIILPCIYQSKSPAVYVYALHNALHNGASDHLLSPVMEACCPPHVNPISTSRHQQPALSCVHLPCRVSTCAADVTISGCSCLPTLAYGGRTFTGGKCQVGGSTSLPPTIKARSTPRFKQCANHESVHLQLEAFRMSTGQVSNQQCTRTMSAPVL